MPTAPKCVLAAGYQLAKSGHVYFQQKPLILSSIAPPGQGDTIILAMQIFRIVATVLHLYTIWKLESLLSCYEFA